MSKNNKQGAQGEYKIGRGKPPAHTRFKKGQSGNPKGRPTGVSNIKTLLNANLGKTMVIRENGEAQEVTGADAVVLKMMQLCMAGDRNACTYIIDKIEKHWAPGDDEVRQDFPREDEEILARAISQARGRVGRGGAIVTATEAAQDEEEFDE